MYHATSLTNLQSVARPWVQSAGYRSKWHKSNNFQRNCNRDTINNVGTSSFTSARRSNSRRGAESAAVSDAGVASLTNSTPTFVNTVSTDSFDNAPCCGVCLVQCQRASKYPMIPRQLRIKFMQSRKGNLKTVSRRRPSNYRQRCGRPSPLSLKTLSRHERKAVKICTQLES